MQGWVVQEIKAVNVFKRIKLLFRYSADSTNLVSLLIRWHAILSALCIYQSAGDIEKNYITDFGMVECLFMHEFLKLVHPKIKITPTHVVPKTFVRLCNIIELNTDVVCDLKHSTCIFFLPLLHIYFSLTGYPSGLTDKLQALDELKVKGLIIGPIHVSSADKPEELNLTEISKEAGGLAQFQELIKAAHKRGEL